MINVLINGACGRMGKKVKEALALSQKARAVCGVDLNENLSDAAFLVYADFQAVKEPVDVIIDFSAPASLAAVLNFAEAKNCAAVLCATGYSEEQLGEIKKASEKLAIFRSANMSLGVNVLIRLVKQAAAALKDFDAEIIEMHHNKKVDAPSGTAIMLAEGIKDVCPEKFCVYGRNGAVGKRDKNEIGVHALRGGNVVGEHEVIFAGENETVTLSHSAADRGVFANGAVKAAEFIYGKKSGLYNMDDLLGEINA